MKTKADYIAKLNREISERFYELHEAFGVDIDTLEKTLTQLLLFMRVEETEQRQKNKSK